MRVKKKQRVVYTDSFLLIKTGEQEMKLTETIAAYRVLSAHADEKLPFAVAYKIMKLIKTLEIEHDFYLKTMQSIIDEYGEKSPEGEIIRSEAGNVKIQNGKMEECNAKVKELEETECSEANLNIKFTPEELSAIQFSVNELSVLEPYIQQ